MPWARYKIPHSALALMHGLGGPDVVCQPPWQVIPQAELQDGAGLDRLLRFWYQIINVSVGTSLRSVKFDCLGDFIPGMKSVMHPS